MKLTHFHAKRGDIELICVNGTGYYSEYKCPICEVKIKMWVWWETKTK